MRRNIKLLYVVNEAFFFVSHRLAVAKAAVEAGFEVHVAAPEDNVWAPDWFSTQHLCDLGFAFHPIPLSRRGTNPVSELRTFVSILRLYKELRPDLVHQLTIKPVLYGGIAARMAKVPAVVSTVTGLGQLFVGTQPLERLLRSVARFAYGVATRHPNMKVIVQNSHDRSVLASSRMVAEKHLALVRGSGAALDQFFPRPEQTGPPVIILPARLIWEKGIEHFVEMAHRLSRDGVSARFVLVGDSQPSNPRSVPTDLIGQWVEEGSIEWWGRRDDMPAVFAESHIVCLPTRYGEGVPKVLIEAAASGRAIVATDIPGCREIVQNHKNGILVPVGDIDELCSAVKQLIADADLRRSYGAAGRKIALESYDENQIASANLAIYQELLKASA